MCIKCSSNYYPVEEKSSSNCVQRTDGFYIDLALTSRMAFAYTFKMEKRKVLKSANHINESIKFLNTTDPKNRMVKAAYGLVTVFFKFNIDRNFVKTDKINSALETFKEALNEHNQGRANFDIFNMNEFYMDVLVVNQAHQWGIKGNNHIDAVFNQVKNNPIGITQETIPSFVFGVYNRISGLTENIITDPSVAQQKRCTIALSRTVGILDKIHYYIC